MRTEYGYNSTLIIIIVSSTELKAYVERQIEQIIGLKSLSMMEGCFAFACMDFVYLNVVVGIF